jgi:hypothetical protein
MSATSGHKTSTGNLQLLQVQKAEGEAKIKVLRHLLQALCNRELNGNGRQYVNKLIRQYEHDVRTIEADIGSSGRINTNPHRAV